MRRLLLLSFSYFLILPVTAQRVAKQEIEVRFDPKNPAIARVIHTLYFASEISPADTLRFYNFADAYGDIHSQLGRSVAGHYKLEFHFSSEKERGYLKMLPSKAYYFIKTEGFISIIPNHTVKVLQLQYQLKLPDIKFTGLGYGKEKYHLSEFFLQETVHVKGKTLLYQNKNLNDRPHQKTPTEIVIRHPDGRYHWQSNGKIFLGKDFVIIKHPNTQIEIVGTTTPFVQYKIKNHTIVLEHSVFTGPTVRTALALDKILNFLHEKQFPLPEKILITRRDLNQNPVYGVDWLPVLNPFPENFKTETSLLKQILYKSGEQLYWDRRKDHSIFTGLWQYYIKKYIEQYHPEMRLTGKPVKWPLLKNYHLLNIPYTQKFKQTYMYIARMNRDQALSLPADSLTRFNRNAANPFKAALTWEFIAQYENEHTFRHIMRQWFERAENHYVNADTLRFLLNEKTGDKLDFLFTDYFHTARKIDFKLKIQHQADSSIHLKIKNKTSLNIPVSLETYHDSVTRKFLPGFKNDTLVQVGSGVRYLTLNAWNPLPEILEKDNFVPLEKRPVKIRFFQDLEDPHSIQLFINPDFDYNYYDGIILGLGLSNQTFFDKAFTWMIIPNYGIKSRYWGGFASVKYKKHFVKPLLHGFSLGGYIDSYHYAPEKTYTSYSLYATLSHKNRREKFFKENDLSLEWLHVNKETFPQDATSRYGVLILRNTFKSRGLLKQTLWTGSIEYHPQFVKLQTDFRFRTFMDKFRQIEWRIFAGWMPKNRTGNDYFSFALSRPTDYLFKYNYYGRSETSGLFHQQYIFAEGAFKIFYDDQYADRWMFVHNVYLGIYKRFNLFVDFGWMKSRNTPVRFRYDAGLRYYLVPDFFELFFPVYYDGRFVDFNHHYWHNIRIMFVFDLPGLFKMFTRSWY